LSTVRNQSDRQHVNPLDQLILPSVDISEDQGLSLDQMKLLDNHALSHYQLPIELMMENAGYGLANLVRSVIAKGVVVVGCGTGNNGGGGLVAARRLLGWGYDVYLDLPNPKLRNLAKTQLQRALSFGAKLDKPPNPALAIDAYFGFSFRAPMPIIFQHSIEWFNALDCPVISLDLPSGLTDSTKVGEDIRVKPDAVCTLAAVKTVLLKMDTSCRLFVVDIGIPESAYADLQLPIPQGISMHPVYVVNARNKA